MINHLIRSDKIQNIVSSEIATRRLLKVAAASRDENIDLSLNLQHDETGGKEQESHSSLPAGRTTVPRINRRRSYDLWIGVVEDYD